jgi:uncharacterized protein YjbJ (UPF0337 family)
MIRHSSIGFELFCAFPSKLHRRGRVHRSEVRGMNKEQVTGKLDELKGKAKEKIGEVTNNPDTEAEGLVDQGKGKLKQAYGDVKEAVKKDNDRQP